jgi:hypothetical protein
MPYIRKATEKRIIELLKINVSIVDLRKQFNATEGQIIEIMKQIGMYGSTSAKVGYKSEPYFEGDFNIIPNYSVNDLSGQEKVIYEALL